MASSSPRTRRSRISQISFLDLTVPTAGLPLQMTRTYDSRKKTIGDFGVASTLGLGNVQAAESQVTGAAWNGTTTGGLPQLLRQPASAHVVTVYPAGSNHLRIRREPHSAMPATRAARPSDHRFTPSRDDRRAERYRKQPGHRRGTVSGQHPVVRPQRRPAQ